MAAVQMVNVRIPLPLLASLDSITERQRRTRHATILVALEQYAKRNSPAGTLHADEATPARRNHADANHSTAEVNRG
jgi:predicted transcriptional regulator